MALGNSTRGLVLSLAFLAPAPFAATATHADDFRWGSGHQRESELERARRELAAAEAAWRSTVNERDAARSHLDGARSRQGHVIATLAEVTRRADGLRRDVDAHRAAVARLEAECGRVSADVVAIEQRLRLSEQRLAAARHYLADLKARHTAAFESSRQYLYATDRLAAAQRDVQRIENAAMGYLIASPHYRLLNAEVRTHEASIQWIKSRWPVNRQQLAEAERRLALAKHNLEDFTQRTLAVDPAVIAARRSVLAASAALESLRAGFARDLETRRDVRDAIAAVAAEENAVGCAASDLSAARSRHAAVHTEIERQAACLGQVAEALRTAEAELAGRQSELRDAERETAAAAHRHVLACEQESAARSRRDEAASRVAHLEDQQRRSRRDDREDRGRGRDYERGPRFRER